jgi:hypothetical protein
MQWDASNEAAQLSQSTGRPDAPTRASHARSCICMPQLVAIFGGQVVVAITVTGDAPCRATDVDYRTDTPSARAFLATYVSLP